MNEAIKLPLLYAGVLLSSGPFLPCASFASDCPVTLPSESQVETGMMVVASHDWYGSSALAARIPRNGQWKGMGPDNRYADKFWWWRKGYDARIEPQPDLTVTATRIDGFAPVVEVADATSGRNDTWNAMLVGMEFPGPGCWEITGNYAGKAVLTIVVQVGTESD